MCAFLVNCVRPTVGGGVSRKKRREKGEKKKRKRREKGEKKGEKKREKKREKGDEKKHTQCALGVVDPVGRKQAAKGRHKDDAAVVVDRLGQLADLVGLLGKAHVVGQELDAGTGDGDTALERVDGRMALAKVVGDGREQARARDDGLSADIVQQEAAGAVGVLGLARVEAALADEGTRLVAQAAGDADAGERAVGNKAKGGGVRRGHDARQLDLGAVDAEKGQQVVVVLQRLKVHKHGAAGVGAVGDVDAIAIGPARGPAVELVDEP